MSPSDDDNVSCISVPRNVLLATNHLVSYAGSELVIIELAEEFRRLGSQVSVFANQVGDLLRSEPVLQGSLLTDRPDLASFDFVWSQHLTLGQLLPSKPDLLPNVVTVHLSPFELFEMPLPRVENAVASLVVANSAETSAELVRLGIDPNLVHVFPNPAPFTFAEIRRRSISPLKNVLLVSHHPPAEVVALADRLRIQGLQVEQLGTGYEHRRLRPQDLQNASAVISIGKTVQYCIQAGVPVFCYDHFGGPGWLTAENFETAGSFNFSGRGLQTRREAPELLSEFVNGYVRAAEFAANQRSEVTASYSLSDCLSTVLASRRRPTELLSKAEWETARRFSCLVGRESADRLKACTSLATVQEQRNQEQAVSDEYIADLRRALTDNESAVEQLERQAELKEEDSKRYVDSLLLSISEKEKHLHAAWEHSEEQRKAAELYSASLLSALEGQERLSVQLERQAELKEEDSKRYVDSLLLSISEKEKHLHAAWEHSEEQRKAAELYSASLLSALEGQERLSVQLEIELRTLNSRYHITVSRSENLENQLRLAQLDLVDAKRELAAWAGNPILYAKQWWKRMTKSVNQR